MRAAGEMNRTFERCGLGAAHATVVAMARTRRKADGLTVRYAKSFTPETKRSWSRQGPRASTDPRCPTP